MTLTPPRCFVIGPIGEAGSAIRRKADWMLNGLIKPVLEASTFGYLVKRADQDPNPGSISDAMINDIYEADLVVAGLTGFNPNAFYELGIRHAFQKPAIHIIAERGMKPPFDNQDQRTIEVDFDDFHHVEKAKRLLVAAVEYVRGENFRVSNPVTRARGFAELIASGDPRDVLIASLQGDLNAMSVRLRRLETPARSEPSSVKPPIPVTGAMIERVGEYYDYIMNTVGTQYHVAFPPEVISAALSAESESKFITWYIDVAISSDKPFWLTELRDLDQSSFEHFASFGRMLDVLNPVQLKELTMERERRAAT